jgi:hypothetical protein
MSSSDYKAALDVTPGPHPSPGRVTEAPWDGGLAQALTASGAAILEEAVADALLADLGATSPGS